MPLLGFSPGLPSDTAGIVTDCENWIPFDAGMEASPSMSTVSATVAPATATGAATIVKLDGSRRTFVGTTTKLYELSAGSWTDVSQSASAYVSGSIWTFAQFGDATLAANYGNVLQASSTSSFSAVVGAPNCKIVETVVTSGGGFVFAFNIDGSAYPASFDRWWCSALNDHTDWSVQAATQCTTGRLLGPGGEIVAAKRLGADGIVAYKQTALFHGRYIGGTIVWAWTEVPQVGAVGRRAVADIGSAHFIVSQTGFWLYDGARPVRIGEQVRQWFLDNVDYANIDKTEVVYDRSSNRVFVFFARQGYTGLSHALVWSVSTQQWGLSTYGIETSMFYTDAGVTYATDAGTYAAATGTFGEATANKSLLAAFNQSHKMVTLTGTPATSWFQTSDMGDPSKSSRLTEAYLQYKVRPETASVSGYGSFALGGVEGVGPQSQVAYDEIGSSNTPGRFTLRQYARYHRLQFNFTGTVQVTGYTAKIEPKGSR